MRVFLESTPPGKAEQISDVTRDGVSGAVYSTPNIMLHCTTDVCDGVRTFTCDDRKGYFADGTNVFFRYTCRNCNRNWKIFSIRFTKDKAIKFGEMPSFGPPTPARAMTLIGRDRELFLKGRRCETQSLGIGAFTYYRRVIEDQRDRIFDEIIRVLEATKPGHEVIAEVRAAKKEQQFTKSIEAIKHAMPDSLLINGQNPLRLLHSALSEGVHALSDEECLALATAVKTVLVEFSERLAAALREDAELKSALNLLSKAKSASQSSEPK